MPSKLLEAKTQVETCLSCSLPPLRCTVYLQACDTAAELGGVAVQYDAPLAGTDLFSLSLLWNWL